MRKLEELKRNTERLLSKDQNTYRIYYKNGKTLDIKYYSCVPYNGNYVTLRDVWNNNPVPGFISGEYIERIECIERNNLLDFE